VILFRVDLGLKRYLAIGAVCAFGILGAVVRDTHLDLSSLWVVCCPLVSSLAGVANDYALKKTNLGINVQNAILYALCAFSSGLYVAIKERAVLETVQGMPADCWRILALQMLIGIVISRILKHTSALVKQLVVSVRSPLMIAAYFILLHQPINLTDMLFACLVAFSALFYIIQGPVGIPNIEKK